MVKVHQEHPKDSIGIYRPVAMYTKSQCICLWSMPPFVQSGINTLPMHSLDVSRDACKAIWSKHIKDTLGIALTKSTFQTAIFAVCCKESLICPCRVVVHRVGNLSELHASLSWYSGPILEWSRNNLGTISDWCVELVQNLRRGTDTLLIHSWYSTDTPLIPHWSMLPFVQSAVNTIWVHSLDVERDAWKAILSKHIKNTLRIALEYSLQKPFSRNYH